MMDWQDCFNKRIIKDIKPDYELIKSLVKSSNNKLESENKLITSNITTSSKISLAYDSLRELLEALAIKKGYKIYNHECYVPFLKEIIDESDKGDIFDEIRKIRNAVNYYGKDIPIQEANDTVAKIKNLRNSILDLLNI
ncbi:hypothetical protein J4214_03270 [Candidatus Woesearchaeota archaeon]|nr:hypothetical protein [Candidatus Woesearchaeota archaeon]